MRRLILPIALAGALAAAAFIAFRPAWETLFENVSGRFTGAELAATPDPETQAALEAALAQAVARNQDAALALIVYDVRLDRAHISADGEWALLWIAAYERGTGELAAMEPWIAIGRRGPPSVPPGGGEGGPPLTSPPIGETEGGWTVTFPNEPGFSDLFAELPENLLSPDERRILGEAGGDVCDTSGIGPFTGYKLPWEGGQTLFLTQSIYHTLGWGFNPTFSMLHAFDFATSPSVKFDIWAVRPGTVKFFWDEQVDGDPNSPGNYIVLEDTGTNPKSYQLYLHLSQGSIPNDLRIIGAPVQQGQIVGLADDTGFSTGHHLHFQVHTEVSWWGCSVDVRFADVPINGGRPRLPIEAAAYPEYGAQGQTTYVSGNVAPPTDVHQPGGGLIGEAHGQTIGPAGIALSGYAFDYQTGVETASFAVRTVGDWTPVGETYSFSPAPGSVFFDGTVDLCSLGLPDGAVTLGVIVEDKDGNVLAGGLAVPAVLDADCAPPPPACVPAANQAALFALPDYKGACVVYGLGTHTQASAPVHSVLVGADVTLTLYKTVELTGRARSFWADNANMSDDWSSAENFAGIIVKSRSTLPNVPKTAWPTGGVVLPIEDALNIAWDDGGGGAEFQVQLDGPAGTATSAWIGRVHWNPGALAAGDYAWQVRARSTVGTTAWSPSASFSISPSSAVSPTGELTAPVSFDFETGAAGWTTTGFWNLLQDADAAFNGAFTFWYGKPPGVFEDANYLSTVPNTGSLTSPPIFIPTPGFNLRFFSNTEIEAERTPWDRRSVYIAVESGSFFEVFVKTEDTPSAWVRSPFIDLSAYTGQTIRVRFVFDTLDARRNGFPGWRIDQVTLLAALPPACPNSLEPDDAPAEATILAGSLPADGEICPAGDVDYFSFSGSAGDRVIIDIDAQTNGSELDAAVFLFDGDGTSLLAHNDDETAEVLLDPWLPYTLPRTGTYYIEVRQSTHPGAAAEGHTYRLTVLQDNVDPSLSNFTPSVPLQEPSALPPAVVLSVDAADGGLGVGGVEFFYHSGDWGAGDWISLGIDTDGSNGWSAVWDTIALPAQSGMALIARAVDGVGNPALAGMWDLFPMPPAAYLPVIVRE